MCWTSRRILFAKCQRRLSHNQIVRRLFFVQTIAAIPHNHSQSPEYCFCLYLRIGWSLELARPVVLTT